MKQVVGVLLCCLILFSCKEEKKENGKLYIVTTTQMIADAVRNIVGEHAEVVSLMGPGVDPHFYKATQGDLKKFNKADIIFYNGLHLEGKMQDLFEKFAKQKIVVAVSKDIPKEELLVISRQGEETLYDPHIWHSSNIWQKVLQPIASTLELADPTHVQEYYANAEGYKEQLVQLNQKIKDQAQEIPKEQRLLITSHDAFNYYGREYDIEVKGLQGISTVSEIGIKDITQMVDLIIQRNVKAVFVESSVNERNLTAVIEGCKKKGWDVKIGGTLFSDAMGNDNTPEGTYIGMIKHNTHAIVNALK